MDHHLHCNNCFLVEKCKHTECEIITCKNGCRSKYHECKQLEHELLCQNALVECINQCNGCEIKFPRYRLAKHLSVCPASVVVCSYEWCRWGIEKKLMHSLKSVPRNFDKKNAEQLDIALTMRDQRVLIKELNGLNTTYSIDPYNLSISTTTSAQRKTEWFTTLEEIRFKVTTFWCNKQFRRDEYAAHYKNIHYDIAELLPRLEQRCPLFDSGCMFSQTTICPSRPGWMVSIAKAYGAVCVKPLVDETCKVQSTNNRSLADFPQEVLEHIFGFVDTLSLLHLMKVNKRIKEIVWSRVKYRGVVEPVWKNVVTYDERQRRKSVWEITHMNWTFSTAMGAITKWLDNETKCHISDHLKVCPYFQRVNHKVPYFAFWPNHPEVKENAEVLAKLEKDVSVDSSHEDSTEEPLTSSIEASVIYTSPPNEADVAQVETKENANRGTF